MYKYNDRVKSFEGSTGAGGLTWKFSHMVVNN